jgi:hypothetical protein
MRIWLAQGRDKRWAKRLVGGSPPTEYVVAAPEGSREPEWVCSVVYDRRWRPRSAWLEVWEAKALRGLPEWELLDAALRRAVQRGCRVVKIDGREHSSDLLFMLGFDPLTPDVFRWGVSIADLAHHE